jgi:hypothetical protein
MEVESPEITDDDYPGPKEPCPAGYTDPGADGVINAVECDRCGAYVARGRTGRHDVFHEPATFAHDVFPDLATPGQ